LGINIKKNLKKIIYYFASFNFLIKYQIKKIKNNQIIILNLHRVTDQKNSSYSPLSYKIFEKMIIFLTKNFKITTFSEVKNLPNCSKPLLILSFDDGYDDFYTNVMPISKKYEFKVNLNIIPNCIEKGEPPINILFQDFIYQVPLEKINQISLENIVFKKKKNLSIYGNELSTFIKNKSYNDQIKLSEEINKKYFSKFDFKKTKIMNKEQLIECASYHEIGVHSYFHSNMVYETNEFFINDTKKCLDWFKKNLNFKPKIYAFPNNSYREEQIEILKQMGFEHILLVNDDFSIIGNTTYNRFNFYADSFNEAKCRAVGYKIK
tara:strand:- start:6515 stop:7477 length:963 start_codon:yes stop_codon:yes gene_type:complete